MIAPAMEIMRMDRPFYDELREAADAQRDVEILGRRWRVTSYEWSGIERSGKMALIELKEVADV